MRYPRPVRVWRIPWVAETHRIQEDGADLVTRGVPGQTSGVTQGARDNPSGVTLGCQGLHPASPGGAGNHIWRPPGCRDKSLWRPWGPGIYIWRPPEWRDKSLCHPGVQEFMGRLASPRVP